MVTINTRKFNFVFFGTAQLLGIFKVIHYSKVGSNSRNKEEETFAKFVDYLDECERGKLWFV